VDSFSLRAARAAYRGLGKHYRQQRCAEQQQRKPPGYEPGDLNQRLINEVARGAMLFAILFEIALHAIADVAAAALKIDRRSSDQTFCFQAPPVNRSVFG
jgi:hypothetical protein